jgi:WD40 repeat protein
VIRDSPSHVYHSVLPLSPLSSWLRECYKADLAQEARVLVGLPDRWDACSRRIIVEGGPSAFAHWGDIVAVGLGLSSVVLYNAITGSRMSVLSGHTGTILSLAFSLDGTLLISGSEDKTVKLWDVRTGGTIKTFSDYTSSILTISISPDHATIASGSEDGTICLWDVRTGKCHPTILCHDGRVTAISFSPTNSRRLISSSWDRTVRQWDTGDRQIGRPCHEAGRVAHVAYSSDGTRFVSCGGTVATVRDTESGAEVVKLRVDAPKRCLLLRWCCFSPDDRLVACFAADTIYVWDITHSEGRLVGTLVGHSEPIISIAFSSFLVSASLDRSVKVWHSSNFLTNSTTTYNMPAQLNSTPIESIRLFAEDGVVVTSDSSGVVSIWDLTTGRCESSFPTPAKGIQDTHLTGDTLIVVWRAVDDRAYHVWDVGNNEPLRTVGSSLDEISDLRISGDGSKIFGLGGRCIEARSVQTGEQTGRVDVENVERQGGLVVDGSKVWLVGSKDVGWDFGGREVFHVSLSTGFPDRPRLGLVDPSMNCTRKPAWIQDTVTGNVVFHLPERYMKPGVRRRLDGGYLLIWSRSGEVVVVDLTCVLDNGS